MKKQAFFVLFLMGASVFFFSRSVLASEYSDPARWLGLPSYTSTETDVFYLYPAVRRTPEAGRAAVLEADSHEMRNGARELFEERTEVLERMGDVYAPYYSQIAAELRSLPPAERARLLDGAPKRDVFEAFDYYASTYNLERPFFLVGECQGAELVLVLLSEYMKANASLRGRLLAAYVTDCSVTDEYLRANPHLRLADGPEGWRVLLPSDRKIAGLPQERCGTE